MCGQQPFLKSRIHCEEDGTCEACLKETEFGKDIPQLQSDELREHLEKYLLDRFGPPTSIEVSLQKNEDSRSEK